MRTPGILTDRKLRLFIMALCRGMGPYLLDPRCLQAVQVGEQLADGMASAADVSRALEDVRRAHDEYQSLAIEDRHRLHGRYLGRVFFNASLAVHAVSDNLDSALGTLAESGDYDGHTPVAELKAQRRILKCLFFGRNQHPPIDAAVLTWNDRTVPRIAEGIYAERAFERMPILHDALLDAGCHDEALLTHCRNPEDHFRGCWALDLLLQKQ
jgi:hypothetical protein